MKHNLKVKIKSVIFFFKIKSISTINIIKDQFNNLILVLLESKLNRIVLKFYLDILY